MEEFKDFLPEALGHTIPGPTGLVGIMPHPTASGLSTAWDMPDTSISGVEKATKAPRRRKRAADKDTTGPAKVATSRVSN